MCYHDYLLNQFDKLLETLSQIRVELQLDVITKVELKLNEYKNQLKAKLNEENLYSNTDLNSEEISGLSQESDTNCRKSGLNSDHNLGFNSNIKSNVRKSERIFNRKPKRQQISPNCPQEEQQQEKGLKSSSNEESRLETENYSNCNDGSDGNNCGTDSPKGSKTKLNLSKSNKSENRRKWRRTTDINDLKCKYCGKIWRSLSHLEIHLRTHTGEKLYECQQCGHRFAQLAGLQVHQRRHNNDRRFECELCHKAFYTKIDLNRHKTSHKEFKTITHCCDKCGKGFSESRQLKNHIRYVHEKKESVVCEICGHITHGQHLLYAHKRVKHGEISKYACPVCHTVIGSRSAFVVHLRAHADVKPCACDICGKQFRSQSQVARHKLAHKEGRHECNVCNKKFKTPHHLRRHQVIHSGNKPFDCHLCQYKCNVKSNVVKHVKSVHGIVDFSLAKQTPIADTIETEAFQKGSIVTQQVLNDISVTKGQTITLSELKLKNEIKKREKEMTLKQISQNVCNRRESVKQRGVKHKKDILDDAIASTINNTTTGADKTFIETPFSVGIDMTPTSRLIPVIVRSVNLDKEVAVNPTPQPLKVMSSLAVNSEQHFKDVIALHLTQ